MDDSKHNRLAPPSAGQAPGSASGRISVAAQQSLPGGPFRSLQGRISQLRLVDLAMGTDKLLLETPRLIEAPNWTPDGKALILNGNGGIYRFDLDAGGALDQIAIGSIQDANNDHVLSSDGSTLYISAGGAVYAVAVGGGEPRQVTPEGGVSYFLHGVSPDGQRLACTAIDMENAAERWSIRILDASTGQDLRRLASGTQPVDGPEWSPDGEWIWFSGELAAERAGHAQLFRISEDGSRLEQMVRSSGVDWFPHPAPDGRQVSFLRYPQGTEGHPANLAVEIWLLDCASNRLTRLAGFEGGQGSINVNSWSPDSGQLAYVAYPKGG